MWNSYHFAEDVDAEDVDAEDVDADAWGVDARLLSSDTSALESSSSSCSSLLWSLRAPSSSTTIGASTFPAVLYYNIILLFSFSL